MISCDNKVETHLKRVDKKLFYNNNPYDWRVLQYIDNQNQYIIYKYDGDTLKSLRFIPNEDDIPMISQYEMKFPCDRMDTCFVSMQEQDTLSRPEIGLHDLPCKQYEKIRKNSS